MSGDDIVPQNILEEWDRLPAFFRQLLTPREYLWITDDGRRRLVQEVTEPEYLGEP